MKKLLICFLMVLILLFAVGCGTDHYLHVKGYLMAKTYSVSKHNTFVIEDSSGKKITLKSDSKYLAGWAQIGDKVEVDYDDDLEIQEMKAYK